MGMTRPLGRTWGIALATCAAAMLFVFAGSASAANLCVGTLPADCPAPATTYDGDVAGLTQAISDSITLNGAGTADKIYIGSGTYSSTSGFNGSSSTLELIGTGATKPVLTVDPGAPGNGSSVFSSSNASVKLRNLAIQLAPAISPSGVTATQGGTFTDLTITGPGSSDATGMNLQGSFPEIKSTTIDLPADNADSVGVRAASATNLGAYDVRINGADTGFLVTDSSSITINRAILSTPHGVSLSDSPGSVVSSSLIKPDASPLAGDYSVAVYNNNGNVQSPVGVYNCTLVGGGASAGTTGVIADNTQSSGAANVSLNSTVVYNHDTALATYEAGGDARIDLEYSRYGGAITGAGEVNAGGQSLVGDPGFVNAAGGDYDLTRGSQFVDAGDPAAIPLSSDTDVNRNPRIVSRGAGNIRDIGAYEVQNAAPEAKIQILTAVPSTTSPIAFSAASSTDADGDLMTYSWRFDGSTFANGVTVNKLITIDGPHTVQLTATDQTGKAGTAEIQFTVARGFLALKIKSQNVRMDGRGRFAITMSCPDAAASNCTGRLIFETTKKIEAKRYQDKASGSKAKILRAANYVFSIEPGTTRKLSVRTYGTFQNVLKKHKKFVLIAKMASGSTANATLTANRPTFTLSAPKKKKQR